MTELVWDDGMSVGIDALDDDHKKIIAILVKLKSVKKGNAITADINDIFVELEHYVQLHFSREESILAQAGYPQLEAHKKTHQKFIDKIPQLKAHWLAANSTETSEEINLFLHHWIINHILIEDLDYVQAVHKHPNKNNFSLPLKSHFYEGKVPVWQRFSEFLSTRMKLSQRVFLTTLLPVVVVFVFCVVILQSNYKQYKSMSLLLELNTIISQVNSLTHSLQTERGLSSAVISLYDKEFTTSLVQQRKTTDSKVEQLLTLLDKNKAVIRQYRVFNKALSLQNNFVKLKQKRSMLEDENLTVKQIFQIYNPLILQLLSISESLIHVEMSSKFASDIMAINAIQRVKELTGQVRAKGVALVLSDKLNIYDDNEMNIILGQQQGALHVFNYSANEEQHLICGDFCNVNKLKSKLEKYFNRAKEVLINNNAIDEKSSHLWFRLMTNEVNKWEQVSKQLLYGFNQNILVKSHHLEKIYYMILLFFILFLLTAIFLSITLNRSIINPVRRLTIALHKLSNGQRNLRFEKQKTNDEISEMHDAYEQLRRKLLQADIFQSIVGTQEKELQDSKSQQKHFQQLAFTDALTGAVNRHSFNSILSQEVKKAKSGYLNLSIMALDIDHFKSINDNFGHKAGDDMLIEFYKTCKAAVRSSDIVARIGGEEFVVIMSDASIEHAVLLAERVRYKIEQITLAVNEQQVSITVSIGVAQWSNNKYQTKEEFLVAADKYLYQAKRNGRNKVVA